MSGSVLYCFDQVFFISHIGVGSSNVDSPVLSLTDKKHIDVAKNNNSIWWV